MFWEFVGCEPWPLSISPLFRTSAFCPLYSHRYQTLSTCWISIFFWCFYASSSTSSLSNFPSASLISFQISPSRIFSPKIFVLPPLPSCRRSRFRHPPPFSTFLDSPFRYSCPVYSLPFENQISFSNRPPILWKIRSNRVWILLIVSYSFSFSIFDQYPLPRICNTFSYLLIWFKVFIKDIERNASELENKL